MNELITIQNNNAYIEKETSNILMDLDNKIKELTDLRNTIRNQVKNEMEDKGIIKAISPDGTYSATFTPENKFIPKFDESRFKKENPDMYDEYMTFTKRSSCVTFRMREQ